MKPRPPRRAPRNVKRAQKSKLPRCPVHDVPLLVGHVSKTVQYRYCTIAGCRESLQTARLRPPDPPPAAASRAMLAAADHGAAPPAAPSEGALFPEYCI